MDFHNMKRKELQSFCKKHGIAANLTNREMADRLTTIFNEREKPSTQEHMKDSGENGCENSATNVIRRVKKVKFNPENQTIVFSTSDTDTISDTEDTSRRKKAASKSKKAGKVTRKERKAEFSGKVLDGPVRTTRSRAKNNAQGNAAVFLPHSSANKRGGNAVQGETLELVKVVQLIDAGATKTGLEAEGAKAKKVLKKRKMGETEKEDSNGKKVIPEIVGRIRRSRNQATETNLEAVGGDLVILSRNSVLEVAKKERHAKVSGQEDDSVAADGGKGMKIPTKRKKDSAEKECSVEKEGKPEIVGRIPRTRAQHKVGVSLGENGTEIVNDQVESEKVIEAEESVKSQKRSSLCGLESKGFEQPRRSSRNASRQTSMQISTESDSKIDRIRNNGTIKPEFIQEREKPSTQEQMKDSGENGCENGATNVIRRVEKVKFNPENQTIVFSTSDTDTISVTEDTSRRKKAASKSKKAGKVTRKERKAEFSGKVLDSPVRTTRSRAKNNAQGNAAVFLPHSSANKRGGNAVQGEILELVKVVQLIDAGATKTGLEAEGAKAKKVLKKRKMRETEKEDSNGKKVIPEIVGRIRRSRNQATETNFEAVGGDLVILSRKSVLEVSKKERHAKVSGQEDDSVTADGGKGMKIPTKRKKDSAEKECSVEKEVKSKIVGRIPRTRAQHKVGVSLGENGTEIVNDQVESEKVIEAEESVKSQKRSSLGGLESKGFKQPRRSSRNASRQTSMQISTESDSKIDRIRNNGTIKPELKQIVYSETSLMENAPLIKPSRRSMRLAPESIIFTPAGLVQKAAEKRQRKSKLKMQTIVEEATRTSNLAFKEPSVMDVGLVEQEQEESKDDLELSCNNKAGESSRKDRMRSGSNSDLQEHLDFAESSIVSCDTEVALHIATDSDKCLISMLVVESQELNICNETQNCHSYYVGVNETGISVIGNDEDCLVSNAVNKSGHSYQSLGGVGDSNEDNLDKQVDMSKLSSVISSETTPPSNTSIFLYRLETDGESCNLKEAGGRQGREPSGNKDINAKNNVINDLSFQESSVQEDNCLEQSEYAEPIISRLDHANLLGEQGEITDLENSSKLVLKKNLENCVESPYNEANAQAKSYIEANEMKQLILESCALGTEVGPQRIVDVQSGTNDYIAGPCTPCAHSPVSLSVSGAVCFESGQIHSTKISTQKEGNSTVPTYSPDALNVMNEQTVATISEEYAEERSVDTKGAVVGAAYKDEIGSPMHTDQPLSSNTRKSEGDTKEDVNLDDISSINEAFNEFLDPQIPLSFSTKSETSFDHSCLRRTSSKSDLRNRTKVFTSWEVNLFLGDAQNENKKEDGDFEAEVETNQSQSIMEAKPQNEVKHLSDFIEDELICEDVRTSSEQENAIANVQEHSENKNESVNLYREQNQNFIEAKPLCETNHFSHFDEHELICEDVKTSTKQDNAISNIQDHIDNNDEASSDFSDIQNPLSSSGKSEASFGCFAYSPGTSAKAENISSELQVESKVFTSWEMNLFLGDAENENEDGNLEAKVERYQSQNTMDANPASDGKRLSHFVEDELIYEDVKTSSEQDDAIAHVQDHTDNKNTSIEVESSYEPAHNIDAKEVQDCNVSASHTFTELKEVEELAIEGLVVDKETDGTIYIKEAMQEVSNEVNSVALGSEDPGIVSLDKEFGSATIVVTSLRYPSVESVNLEEMPSRVRGSMLTNTEVNTHQVISGVVENASIDLKIPISTDGKASARKKTASHNSSSKDKCSNADYTGAMRLGFSGDTGDSIVDKEVCDMNGSHLDSTLHHQVDGDILLSLEEPCQLSTEEASASKNINDLCKLARDTSISLHGYQGGNDEAIDSGLSAKFSCDGAVLALSGEIAYEQDILVSHEKDGDGLSQREHASYDAKMEKVHEELDIDLAQLENGHEITVKETESNAQGTDESIPLDELDDISVVQESKEVLDSEKLRNEFLPFDNLDSFLSGNPGKGVECSATSSAYALSSYDDEALESTGEFMEERKCDEGEKSNTDEANLISHGCDNAEEESEKVVTTVKVAQEKKCENKILRDDADLFVSKYTASEELEAGSDFSIAQMAENIISTIVEDNTSPAERDQSENQVKIMEITKDDSLLNTTVHQQSPACVSSVIDEEAAQDNQVIQPMLESPQMKGLDANSTMTNISSIIKGNNKKDSLIPRTPRTCLKSYDMDDMEENMPTSKREQVINKTDGKIVMKRKALGDIH